MSELEPRKSLIRIGTFIKIKSSQNWSKESVIKRSRETYETQTNMSIRRESTFNYNT